MAILGRVAAPESGRAQLEHVDLTLQFPQPHVVDEPVAWDYPQPESGASLCRELKGVSQSACKRWLERSERRQRAVAASFRRRYRLAPRNTGTASGAGAVRAWVAPDGGGYYFEAEIPASALPAAAEAPVSKVRYAAHIVDMVGSPPTTITRNFFSGAQADRAGGSTKLATWKPATHFGRFPLFLEAVARATTFGAIEGVRYSPTPTTTQLDVLSAPLVGVVFDTASPRQEHVDLTRTRIVARLGQVILRRLEIPDHLAASSQTVLAAFVGGNVRSTAVVKGLVRVHVTRRGPGWHVFVAAAATAPKGECGLCPSRYWSVFKLSRAGKFRLLAKTDSLTDEPDMGVRFFSSANFETVGVRGRWKAHPHAPVEVRELRWNAKRDATSTS